jgi:catechol-2,3-dioxygenase
MPNLKVCDLDRSIAFYTQFLALQLSEGIGDSYAFLAGVESHHESALRSVAPAAPQRPAAATGLSHVAFEVPSRPDFAAVYRALTEASVHDATLDYLISWATYFDDPDGKRLEIYWDTRGESGRRAHWHGENRPLPAAMIRSD